MPDSSLADQPVDYRGCVNPLTEALVLGVIFRERDGYPRARLEKDLDDLNPEWVAESLASLHDICLIEERDGTVYRSGQLARLVALDAITF
jgi:hypothetical protein